MSFISTRSRSRARARHGAMSGWIDDFVESLNTAITGPKNAAESGCLGTANDKVRHFDAQIADLDKNWTPSGFYTPQQMQSLIGQVQAAMRQASAMLDREEAEPTAQGDRSALQMERSAIARKMNESLDFTRAFAAALDKGITAIDSPGFKRYIVSSMKVARDAVTAATYVACNRPWFVSALALFQSYFDAVWNLAKKVVGVVVELGQQVLEIPDTVATVWKYTKIAALLVGGYYAYTEGPRIYRELTR